MLGTGPKLITADAVLRIAGPRVYRDVLIEIPGFRDTPDTSILGEFDATPVTAWRIRTAFPDSLSVTHPQVEERFNRLVTEHERFFHEKQAHGIPNVPIRTKLAFWKHQKEACNFAIFRLKHEDWWHRCAVLWMWMGTGKSAVSIAVIDYFGVNFVLIICPRRVLDVWPRQFQTHAFETFEVTVIDPNDSAAKKCRAFETSFDKGQKGIRSALVVNYDAVWRDPLRNALLERKIPFLVMDEVHRCRNATTRIGRFMSRFTENCDLRLSLSGTLVAKPEDLFGIGKVTDVTILGPSRPLFFKRHVVSHPAIPGAVIGYKAVDQLADFIYKLCYVAGPGVLDLPEAIHCPLYTDLNSTSRKAYNELDRDLVTWVGEGADEREVNAATVLSRFVRLRQITSGFTKDVEGKELPINDAKAELLGDFLDDLDPHEPLVIFAFFERDLATIREVCEGRGRKVLELSGKKNEWQRWQYDKEGEVLIAQTQSGSEGVDFTRACYTVFYSLDFSLKNYQQAVSRTQRPGQTRPCRFYHLIVKNTVDGDTYELLDKRQNVVEMLLAMYRLRKAVAA